MITAENVLETLRTVIDPCSINAGVPISIVDMGLVPSVVVTEQGDLTDVHVSLTVTEPTCLMYHAFARESEHKLRALTGIGNVSIEVRQYTMWTEDLMSPEAREQLAQRRNRRRIPVTAI